MWDAERLPNGNYLAVLYHDSRIVEITKGGKVVWTFKSVKMPLDADRQIRVYNGNQTGSTDVIIDVFGYYL